MPDLIDLDREAGTPPPLPPKKATRPVTLGLDKEAAVMTKEPLLPLPAHSKCRPGKTTGAGSQSTVEQVPEEQVIYIDDYQEPSPLSLLQ